jgi:hypothetical protein
MGLLDYGECKIQNLIVPQFVKIPLELDDLAICILMI